MQPPVEDDAYSAPHHGHRRAEKKRFRDDLADWYRQPFDYEWIVTHRSTRSLQRSVQSVFGAATLVFAAASILMLFSSRGPHGYAAQAWVVILLLAQLLVAARWFFGPLPNRRDMIAFAIFGDLGLSSVLLLYYPYSALIGAGLFVITGALCTFFLSPRLVLAHVAWCGAFIALLTVHSCLVADEDVVTSLASGLVVISTVTGVPVLAHIAWTAIGRDARRSLVDPLTGLLNRRGLDDAAEDLAQHSLEVGHSLVVLVIDIDRFKRVNDLYGHDRGDDVIVSVARRLAALFVGDGIAARTGGEEFVAVFAGPQDRVHERIAAVGRALFSPDDAIPVTVSVGASIIEVPSIVVTRDFSIITRAVRAADSMMYRAKYEGGNRTMSTYM